MLIKILLLLAAIIIVVLLIAGFQPSHFQIVRSTTIAASPEALFAEVNDLHRWPAWSPYEKLDPAMKRSFEGAPAGVGAIYAWDGNKEVGTGRMTIRESRPAELIRLKLEFYKPMAGVCEAEFSFKPELGGRTAVTWSMAGTNNYLAKIFCLFMNMDKMVGGQFEQGLANLKTLAETTARK
jgi:uncharacterized protein YndB with AHSA1/START domain